VIVRIPAGGVLVDANLSPRFTVDESALLAGVRTLAGLAADYLVNPLPPR
jgi:hypothetical protein